MTLNIKDVLTQANAAYKEGHAEESIRILEMAMEKNESTELYNALSISYRRTGNETRLAETLKKALLFDPKNLRACILEGAMHEQASKPRLALQSYSRAQTIARTTPPHDIALQRDIKAIQTRIPAVMKALEVETYQAFKALGTSSSNDEDRRFTDTLDILFGKKEIFHQRPHQLYIPDLPQKQFYSARDFDWVENLKSKFNDIRTEAKALLGMPEVFAPYLESKDGSIVNSHVAMVDNADWSAFYFIRDGQNVEAARDLCPVTFKALDDIDLCRTEGGTPSVLFSLLKPGAHIPPHTGMLNCRLICHLPLIVPNNCGLRVGNRTVEWKEGEMLVFDDSIEHEAWNKSEFDRIVLLFDIWRPEITIRERKLIGELLRISNQ